MMEFEEIQKVWSEQKSEEMYAVNENALHNSIRSKQKEASKKMNRIEIDFLVFNLLFLANTVYHKEGLWDYVGALMMVLAVAFMIFFRYRRKKSENKFDRSMLGELDHAISTTRSILKITKQMSYYYILPTAVFAICEMIYFKAPFQKWLITIGVFVIVSILMLLNHKYVNLSRKKHLESLRDELTK
ncbi:MAG: hypothetical protein AAF599_18305 [Bacteroidota bacterium]